MIWWDRDRGLQHADAQIDFHFHVCSDQKFTVMMPDVAILWKSMTHILMKAILVEPLLYTCTTHKALKAITFILTILVLTETASIETCYKV